MEIKHIKVKGIPREPLDTDQYAYILWRAAKAAQREKRERDAREKAKQRRRADER